MRSSIRYPIFLALLGLAASGCVHDPVTSQANRGIDSVGSPDFLLEAIGLTNSTSAYLRLPDGSYELNSMHASVYRTIEAGGTLQKYNTVSNGEVSKSPGHLTPSDSATRLRVVWKAGGHVQLQMSSTTAPGTKEFDLELKSGTEESFSHGGTVSFEMTDNGKKLWADNMAAEARKLFVDPKMNEYRALAHGAVVQSEAKSNGVEIVMHGNSLEINEPGTTLRFLVQ